MEILTNLRSPVKYVKGVAETDLERGRGQFILGLVEFKKPSRRRKTYLGAVGNMGQKLR